MENIEIQKCEYPEKFLEIIDNSIQYLQQLREKIRQEVFYDELR